MPVLPAARVIGKRGTPAGTPFGHLRQHDIHIVGRRFRKNPMRFHAILLPVPQHVAILAQDLREGMAHAGDAASREDIIAGCLIHDGHARGSKHHGLVRADRQFNTKGLGQATIGAVVR